VGISDVWSPSDAGTTSFLSDEAADNAGIDDYLEGQIELHSLVGLAAAVVDGRSIRYLKAFGFEDREAEITADPRRTVWRLASLSKGVTGVIATRLAKRQEIDLDAPLPDLAPDFVTPNSFLPFGCNALSCAEPLSANAPTITLDLLLHHRAGIPHYSNGLSNPAPDQELSDSPEHNTGLRWALSGISGQPLVAEPGQRYRYSSFGYNLAGVVLEVLTNRSFDALLASEVSEPAQAPSLQVERLWQPIERAAVPYKQGRQGMQREAPNDISWKAPGGGLVATVADMARYCGALLHRRLTGAHRDSVLWSPAPDGSYAHGFMINETTEQIEHNGSQQGARTALVLQPENQRCFVVMTNTASGNAMIWARGMAQAWP
jgi:CubicO group peptidase (beta-lactamase class C family)